MSYDSFPSREIDFDFFGSDSEPGMVSWLEWEHGYVGDLAHDQAECIVAAIAQTYRHFSGGEGTIPLWEINPTYIAEHVRDQAIAMGIYGFEEEVIVVAARYINGRGDDYSFIESIR